MRNRIRFARARKCFTFDGNNLSPQESKRIAGAEGRVQFIAPTKVFGGLRTRRDWSRLAGFSLAEAMITLLMVSIILAAIAPIMSKKMKLTQTGFSTETYRNRETLTQVGSGVWTPPRGLSDFVVTVVGAGGGGGAGLSSGEVEWKTPGTYSWTVPEGVTEIEVTLVSGGAGGGAGNIAQKEVRFVTSGTGGYVAGEYTTNDSDTSKNKLLKVISSGNATWTVPNAVNGSYGIISACGGGGGGGGSAQSVEQMYICNASTPCIAGANGGSGEYLQKALTINADKLNIILGGGGGAGHGKWERTARPPALTPTAGQGANWGTSMAPDWPLPSGGGGLGGWHVYQYTNRYGRAATGGLDGGLSSNTRYGAAPGASGGGAGGDSAYDCDPVTGFHTWGGGSGGSYAGGGGGGAHEAGGGGGGGSTRVLNSANSAVITKVAGAGGGGGAGRWYPAVFEDWRCGGGGGGGGGGGNYAGGIAGFGGKSGGAFSLPGQGQGSSVNSIFGSDYCKGGAGGLEGERGNNGRDGAVAIVYLDVSNGGSGGGGGHMVPSQKLKVTPGETLKILVGAGGKGGTAGSINSSGTIVQPTGGDSIANNENPINIPKHSTLMRGDNYVLSSGGYFDNIWGYSHVRGGFPNGTSQYDAPFAGFGGQVNRGNGVVLGLGPLFGANGSNGKSAGNLPAPQYGPFANGTVGGDGGMTSIDDAGLNINGSGSATAADYSKLPSGWCKVAKGGTAISKDGQSASGFGGCGGGGGYGLGKGGDGAGGYARIRWNVDKQGAGGGGSSAMVLFRQRYSVVANNAVNYFIGDGGLGGRYSVQATSVLNGDNGGNTVFGANNPNATSGRIVRSQGGLGGISARYTTLGTLSSISEGLGAAAVVPQSCYTGATLTICYGSEPGLNPTSSEGNPSVGGQGGSCTYKRNFGTGGGGSSTGDGGAGDSFGAGGGGGGIKTGSSLAKGGKGAPGQIIIEW